MYLILAIVFIFGTVIGSFLNVCIYRMPIGESIVFPPSHCPSCGSKLRFFNLIPIFSYLFQGGKCANCREKISMRYPLVELLTGLIYALIVHKFGINLHSFVLMLLSALLIVSNFTDISHQIIPDKITLPGIIIGLTINIVFNDIPPLNAILGLLVGGGLLYLVAIFSELVLRKEGMGGGDIKLAAMIGSFLGWQHVLVTLCIAVLLGGVAGIILIVFKLRNRQDLIAFGPYIVFGAFMVMLMEKQVYNLVDWYLNLIRVY